jgi:antitoxin ParD1/3/4
LVHRQQQGCSRQFAGIPVGNVGLSKIDSFGHPSYSQGCKGTSLMNVHLTQELEQLVQSRVKSGRYGSASEVVRDALRLLADRDELMELRKQELRKKIAQGLDSLKRGEGVGGEEFFAQLEREEADLDKSPAA